MVASRTQLLFALTATAINVANGRSLPQKRDGLTIKLLDGWQSLGCWTDSQSARTLGLMAHSGQHASDDNCQYQCNNLGYNYAGTEYSGQCYCGNYVGSQSSQAADSDCSMACTGDNTQPCGGPNRINLFWNGKTTAQPPPQSTTTNPGVDNWVSEGCYTDSVGTRSLPNQVGTPGGGSAMTVQLCVDACHNAGYSLAGAEYGGECYCANAISVGGPASSSDCSMTCNGNSSEWCGGPGRMNLYSYGGATPVTNTPPASSSVTPVNPSLPSNWAALGCYDDDVGKRALANFFNGPSSGMTPETCISICSSNGYSIAGVEYGSECYCDNIVNNNHGLASDGNAQCNMKCSGNAGETCGGPSRLNVYAAGPNWVKLGCYTDQPYQRTLATVGSYTGSLTIEKCQAACHAAGFPYAGVEYGQECHCGSSFDNGGGPAPDGFQGCSFQCAGNSTEICGGSQRLSMYEYINADGTVSSTATSSGGTTGNTGSAAATPTPVTSGLATGFTYQGCYIDNTNGRILSDQQPDSSSLTVQSCIAACSAAGYSIAGVEWSQQCFCGSSIINGGVLASADTASSSCHMPCTGASSQSCGGGNLMEIYSSGTPAVSTPATVQTTNLPNGWTYQSCLADSVAARVMPVEQDSAANTATSCINYCSGQGYGVAGLEYSNQCFCTTSLTGNEQTSNQCNMACSGNSNYLCGGPGALSVYVAA